jgi:hypothetical protein
MSFSSWLHWCKNALTRSSGPRWCRSEAKFSRRDSLKARSSPRIELLEDHLAPAAYTVNAWTDLTPTGAGTGLTGDLRYCINASNSHSGQDTITFDSTVFAIPRIISLKNQLALLDKTGQTIINGPGANLLTINSNPASGVFLVQQGVGAVLNGLTIAHGNATSGGAIDNLGTVLTVSNCILTGNSATSGGGIDNEGTVLTVSNCILTGNSATYIGGAIYNNNASGTVNISNSFFSGNYSNSSGGAIYNRSGTVNISNSTFSGSGKSPANVVTASGGAIYNNSPGTVIVSTSTFSSNSAGFMGGAIFNNGTLKVSTSTLASNLVFSIGLGGGIYNDGSNNSPGNVTLSNSTLVGNSANTGGGIYNNSGKLTINSTTVSGNSANTANGVGGGLYSNGGTLYLTNTIVANSPSRDLENVGGIIASAQNNLIQSPAGHNIQNGVNGNIIGQNPLLSPLGNYGGPTMTFALLPGSPALNAGSNAQIPVDPTTGKPYANDVRGAGFPRIVNGTVDIGAFESRGFSLSLSGGGQSTPINTAFASPLTATVSSPYGEPVAGGRVGFAVPATGATAVLSAGSATLSSGGQASVWASANGTKGSYTVNASAAGAVSIGATLTNAAPVVLPYVVSINTSAGTFTDPSSISYTVVFSKPVTGVDATDFHLAASGSLRAAVTSVTPSVTSSSATYSVTVSNIIGGGALGLNLVDDGTIHDSTGNKLVPSPGVPSFQTAQTIVLPGGNTQDAAPVAATYLGSDGQPHPLVFNGVPEIVVASDDGFGADLTVLRRNGSGTFQVLQNFNPFQPNYNLFHGAVSLAVADVDSNGTPDIVIAGGGVAVLEGNPDGTFQGLPARSIVGDGQVLSMTVADLGNHHPDIVVRFATNTAVLWNDGQGNFQLVYSDHPGVVSVRESVAVADLGNGHPDLILGHPDGTVMMLVGDGRGGFSNPTTIFRDPVLDPDFTLAVADLNGDGKTDIVIGNNADIGDNADNTVSVLTNNSTGGSSNFSFAAQTLTLGTPPRAITLADVTGDGHPDIVIASDGGFVGVLTNVTTGWPTKPTATAPAFAALKLFSTGGGRSIAVTDLDNDGKNDIVTRDYQGTVTVVLNSNHADFAGQACTIIHTHPVIQITDFNTTVTPSGETVNLVLSVTQGNSYEASLGYTYVIEGGNSSQTVTATPGNGSGFAITDQFTRRDADFDIPGVLIRAYDADGWESDAFVRMVFSYLPSANIVLSSMVPGYYGNVMYSLNGTLRTDQLSLLYLSDLGGGDSFTVNFGSTLTAPITILGSGSASLTVNGDPTSPNIITKTSKQITWGSPATETVSYSGIKTKTVNANGSVKNIISDPGEDTVINGGPGENTIIITGTTGNGVVINGGPTINTYIVDLGSLDGPVSIANSNAEASDSLVVNGAAGDNIVTVAGSQVTEGTQTISFDAPLGNLTVNGGSGDNQITVSALTVPVQSLTLDGSAGSADTITVSQDVTAPTTITGGGGTNTLTAGGGTTTLIGGGGTNTLIGGTDSNTFIDNGGTSTIVVGTGSNTLVPGTGQDTLQVPPGVTTPFAFPDGYSVLDNGVLGVAAGGVLANDLSPDDQPLTAVLVTGPVNGTLVLNADGSFRYTPAAGFVGFDTFTYQAESSTGTLSNVVPVTIRVGYVFGGFLAPLNSNLAFGLDRTIPIKFQLTDDTGAYVSSLSTVVSLQVLDAQGVDVLSSGGGPALRYDTAANQFILNWATKGLPAGSYVINLVLADGSSYQKTIQLSANGAGGALLVDGSSATTAVGALLGGDIELYVDNSNGALTADELARIDDALTAVDAVTEPYGVAVQEVSDPMLADVTLNMDTTSAVGGYAEGALGCTTDDGRITLISGWDFYAGGDATQIGPAQFDFQTVVTHELGHALGLGHSADADSVMDATLPPGAARRSLVTSDLNVPDTDSGPGGLHAALPPAVFLTTVGSMPAGVGRVDGGNNALIGGAGNDLLVGGRSRDLLIGGAGADRMIGNGGDDIFIGGTTSYDADALAAIRAEWTSRHDYAIRIANLTDQTASAGFLSRLNGDFLLDPRSGQTVFNGSSSDTLTVSAGSDWFFAGTVDKITDLNKIDQAFIFGV